MAGVRKSRLAWRMVAWGGGWPGLQILMLAIGRHNAGITAAHLDVSSVQRMLDERISRQALHPAPSRPMSATRGLGMSARRPLAPIEASRPIRGDGQFDANPVGISALPILGADLVEYPFLRVSGSGATMDRRGGP
jgi:hypothetical protein